MRLFISVLFTLLVFVCNAQIKLFKFSIILCDYEGSYDTTKVTAQQLQNTYQLGFADYYRLTTEATVWYLKDTAKLSIDSLDNEYHRKYNRLEKLNVVKSSYWENYRQQKLTELKQLYELERITMLGYSNPCILKQYRATDSCIKKYQDAICAGGQKLVSVWQEMTEANCKKNGDPDKCRRRFLEMYNSPQRILYARQEVMLFGWWNCALDYVQQAGNASEDEYKKAFKNVKTLGCDDGD